MATSIVMPVDIRLFDRIQLNIDFQPRGLARFRFGLERISLSCPEYTRINSEYEYARRSFGAIGV